MSDVFLTVRKKSQDNCFQNWDSLITLQWL